MRKAFSSTESRCGGEHLRESEGPPNEGLQQTRSALARVAAALAAESWCSPDLRRARVLPGSAW